jgi:PPOX class probable F420-dependent enzyme
MARSPVDEAEARARLAGAPVARLATVASDGRPRVVPFCFAVDGDTLHSAVDHKPKTTTRLRRLDDIAAHPDVTVLVDYYNDDWARLWWVTVRGRAEVVAEPEPAIGLLAAKYAQYRNHPPQGPFIRVALEEWRWWSGA